MYVGEKCSRLGKTAEWMIKLVLLAFVLQGAGLEVFANITTLRKQESKSIEDDKSLYRVTPTLEYLPQFTVSIKKNERSSIEMHSDENYSTFAQKFLTRENTLYNSSSEIKYSRSESISATASLTELSSSNIESSISSLSKQTSVRSSDASHYFSESSQISSTVSYHIIQTLTTQSSRTSTHAASRLQFSSLVCPSVIIISPICINSSYFTAKTSTIFTSIYTSSISRKNSIYSTSTLSSWSLSSKSKSLQSSLKTAEKSISTKIIPKSSILSLSHTVSRTTKHLQTSFQSTFHTTSILQSITAFSKSISPSYVTSSLPLITKAIPINPSVQKCDMVIKDFADAMTNFTQCILLNFHPMRVCYRCFQEHDMLLVKHRNISHACYEKLITDYNMQYQIVPHMYQSQLNTWKSLGCEKCYDRSSSGVLSNDFLEFIKLFDETNECFTNITAAVISNTSHTHNTSDKNPICVDCNEYYQKLQNKFPYYRDDAGDETGTDWCADINTAVNKTRYLWSSVYKCGRVEKDLEAIIALTCFFCFLPIIFYVGAKLHSDVKERKNADRYSNYYDSE